MKTITYRHESAAARALAEQHGLPYYGRERLNTMHVEDEPEELAKAMTTLNRIREESDFFWGQIHSKLGEESWITDLPGKGLSLKSLLAQAQRDLGGRIKISEAS